jgi:hypothetical protein
MESSLWLDELHTSWCVMAGLGDVSCRAQLGSSAPLFYQLVWFITGIAGPQEFALRCLPFLAGSLSIPLAYAVARKFGTCQSGSYLVAFLMAIDFDRVYFATEARVYGVVEFVVLAQVAAFWRVLQRPSWKLQATLVLLSLLLVQLHYVPVLLLLAEGTFVIIWTRFGTESQHRTIPWQSLLVSASVFAVLFLPIAVTMLHTLHDRSQLPISDATFRSIPVAVVASLLPLSCYLALPLAMTVFSCCRFSEFAGSARDLYAPILFCTSWTLIPLALAFAAQQFGLADIFVLRYLGFTTLGLIQIAGLVVSLSSDRFTRIIIVVLSVCVVAFGTSAVIESVRVGPKRGVAAEDWRSAIEFLNRQCEKKTSIVYLRSGLYESEVWWNAPDDEHREFCLFPVKAVYNLDSDRVFALPITAEFRLTPEQIAVSQSSQECWVIVRQSLRVGAHSPADVCRANLERQLTSTGIQANAGVPQRFGSIWVFPIHFREMMPDVVPALGG